MAGLRPDPGGVESRRGVGVEERFVAQAQRLQRRRAVGVQRCAVPRVRMHPFPC